MVYHSMVVDDFRLTHRFLQLLGTSQAAQHAQSPMYPFEACLVLVNAQYTMPNALETFPLSISCLAFSSGDSMMLIDMLCCDSRTLIRTGMRCELAQIDFFIPCKVVVSRNISKSDMSRYTSVIQVVEDLNRTTDQQMLFKYMKYILTLAEGRHRYKAARAGKMSLEWMRVIWEAARVLMCQRRVFVTLVAEREAALE